MTVSLSAALRHPFDFTDKIVLVTGGSRGLGRAISHSFAARGAKVIVSSRKLENCEVVVADIARAGGTALAIGAHMGKWEEAEQLADRAYDAFGRVDILVNNAGMSPISPSSAVTSEALFDKVIGVNFKGPFRLSSLCGSRMAAGEGGSIINISSIGAIRPRPEYGPYAGAKAALNAITVAHAFEFAPKVRVNAILAGTFRTDIAKAWDPDKESKVRSAIPRFGEPEEIVSTVFYLASEASSFTTGALIRVDGGRP